MRGRAPLDDRLRRALDALPGPDDDASARARKAALGAVPPPPPGARSGRRRLLVALTAGVAAALATTGLGLAVTGRIDVRIGAEEPPRREAPAAGEVALAPGMRGLAVASGGRMLAATRGGFRIEARASAAELSPNALFVAAGLGESLVAIAPDGRRAWTQPAGGPVVAAAWAPYPILVAYVVRRGARHELRLIEGNGEGDRLVDGDVAPVRPSWRADTLALAYVGADGRARVLDRTRERLQAPAACAGDVTALAYAPRGDRLAVVGGPEGATVGVDGACLRFKGVLRLTAVAWLSDGELVTAERPAPGISAPSSLRRHRLVAGELRPGGVADAGRVDLVDVRPVGGTSLAVAARGGRAGALSVWEVDAPPGTGSSPLALRRVLARVGGPPGGPVSLAVQ